MTIRNETVRVPGEDNHFLAQEEPQNEEQEGTHLKRELGLLDGASIIIGIIVGSGIFVSPKGVLLYAGSTGLALVVWLISGLICMIGALCYTELGTMIPKSGGDYAYINESFGSYPAFLYLWSSLLVIMPAGSAVTALTFASYILQPFWPVCDPPEEAIKLIATAIICLLTAINCHDVKSATRVQDIFTATKVIALIVIIIAGFVWLGLGHVENLRPSKVFVNSQFSPGYLALSFYSGLFSYAGWNYLNFVTEELKEPNKNLPRAIYVSIPLVTIIYLLTNIAYFAVLLPDEILASNAVAVTYGNRILGVMSWIIPVFVACSTFGAVNGGIFSSSRLFFVGARNGHFPKFMALINYSHLTPMPCLVFLGMTTVALCWTSDVYQLINYASFIESAFIAISVTGLLKLRYTQPDRERPIKNNILLPIIFLITCIFLIILPIFVDPLLVGGALGIVFLGTPFYFLFIYWKNRPKWIKAMEDRIDRFFQKLFLAVPE
ncbi:large neutral amino acids transporter small subunit 1 isoform X1 [Lepeophtheirus salmonis]|uniref:large neutral amino acids transporter small subunit 1 isoform X1 n=2 Tax=Lepeophtheirus salmonis TaxID=72036 RepID=UPI001AEB7673|nr:large neutral amino acids transporter small subunit 1-like isoform X1 [Lepeophtheirus salmonis]XP_040573015.1 large neutral amino acids transporter small subunit 1-like isoform X1 [Lepeophtheirus salmonis]XP_040573016.1 large neutral amino acids transporter small subunit 1-like isoform X1 [Lepeophtheirus salmonis]